MKKLRWFYTYISFFRILLAWICFKTNKFKDKCAKDLAAWMLHYENLSGHSTFFKFGYILINENETRNIFLNRLHRNPVMFVVIRVLYKPVETLYINVSPENIGGGLVFQHGFSTIIAARKIGENCKIFQQVTIGFNGDKAPVIDDNVTVCAGAIIIGNVHVENNAVVGAGAVVTKDVRANSVVAGVPAKVIKQG